LNDPLDALLVLHHQHQHLDITQLSREIAIAYSHKALNPEAVDNDPPFGGESH
jgi:hypothetical protein